MPLAPWHQYAHDAAAAGRAEAAVQEKLRPIVLRMRALEKDEANAAQVAALGRKAEALRAQLRALPFRVGRFVMLAAERHLRDLEAGPGRGLRFDEKVAAASVRFFSFLTHNKGKWAGQPLTLEPWQQFIIASLFGWKRADGTRRFRESYTEVARKNGKALALDTPLPTPSGWTTMGALKVGEAIFDEMGAVCYVENATDVMHNHVCYEVEFSDGTRIVADAGHLWKTDTRRNGRPGGKALKGIKRSDFAQKEADKIRTTEQIRTSLLVDCPAYVAQGKLEYNHRIALSGPLQLPDAALPVDPYVLGAWLGDGSSSSARLTASYADAEILEHLSACGETVQEGRSSNPNSGLYLLGSAGRGGTSHTTSLQARLRKLTVLNNKHIPLAYLRASYTQRLALLQGLMDTDGYASAAGQCEFTTISPALRDGFVELATSLGYKPSVKTATATCNGKDCGLKYRIQFWAYKEVPAFRLSRKAARLKPTPERPTRAGFRQIVAVHPVASVPVRCITVSSASKLFLAGKGMVPTHNSTLGSGVGLKLLAADHEAGAEIYTAATKKEQARIVFSDAQNMARKSVALSKTIRVQQHSIFAPATLSKMVPMSADAKTEDGLNPHGIIIDEYHAHPNDELYAVLKSATGARSQPLLSIITTAGFNRLGPCAQLRKACVGLLEGTFQDDAYFTIIFALDEGDAWGDESTWQKANPNLGVSVGVDYLREQYRAAERTPSLQVNFKTKHLNLWTDASTVWLPHELWMQGACGTAPELLAGRQCWGGLDLASVRDITALVLLFPDGAEGFDVRCWFWVPADAVDERTQKDQAPYRQWVDEGYLLTTPGNVTDYNFIQAEVQVLCETHKVQLIHYDRFNSSQLVINLTDEGVPMQPFGQGFISMSAPTKELEKLVLGGKVHHYGHPVLAWMLSNVELKRDPAGNIKIDKGKSKEKVDGPVALAMALGGYMSGSGESGYIYEDRELLVL